MKPTAPLTLEDLRKRADSREDFEELGDAYEYGELFFKEDREEYNTILADGYRTVAADCIGAVVLGSVEDGDYAAPLVLTHDEAIQRFGLAAIVAAEDAIVETPIW